MMVTHFVSAMVNETMTKELNNFDSNTAFCVQFRTLRHLMFLIPYQMDFPEMAAPLG